MSVIVLILLILAAVCFGLSAFAAPAGRVNLLALGLFAWVLVPLLHAVGRQ